MAPKTTKKKSFSKSRASRGPRSARTTQKQAEEAIRSARDFLRQVIDIDPHFIFAKDRDGRFTLVNQAVADAYGTTIEDLIGKTDADFNPNRAEVASFLKMDREVMESKRERFIPEEVITDAAGKKRWLQTIKRPIIGTDGRANQVLGVSTDITERKKAEETLRQSEQRFHAIYDQTYEFIGLLAPDGTLIDVNQTALAFRGLQRSDVIGKLFWETPWWDLSREIQEKLKAAIAEAAKGEFVRLRTQHQDQDGVVEEIDFSVTPIKDRTGRVTQIIPEGRRITPLTRVLDQLRETQAGLEHRVRERTAALTQLTEQLRAEITERKQAEEALHQNQREVQSSQAQLQDLTAKLFTAQDSERQRIARDLHDDFSQRLVALVLDVAALQRHPPRLPEGLDKALEPVREELTQLADDLHSLAYRLHPPLLRHAGLQPTIEDYISKAIERTGLQIVLQVKHLPGAIPLEWSTGLFRVFQESLQNVVKHAKATEVLVKLSGSSNGIGLSVIDNGKGFDARDKSRHQTGLGLTSMRERLRLLNGFLNIHSRPADGTKVCAWIPFQEQTP